MFHLLICLRNGLKIDTLDCHMVEGRGRENDPIMTSLPIPIPMAAQRETVYYTFLKIFLHIEENETHKVDLINPMYDAHNETH